MPYVVTTPTTSEGPAGGGRLFIRYRLNRGITVYRKGGAWFETRYTTEDEYLAADPGFIFKGGYNHILNDEQRTELIAAGYGSYITLQP